MSTTTAPAFPLGWPVCLANPMDPRISHTAVTVDPAAAVAADPDAVEQRDAGLLPVLITATVGADGRSSVARVDTVMWVPADSLR